MSVPSTPPPSENCAIGFDGQLLDASKIKWFNSPSNENPIPFEQSDLKTKKAKSADVDDGFQEPIGQGHRSKKLTGKAAMMQEIQAELKNLGQPNSKNQKHNIKVQEPSKKQAKHVPKKRKKVNSASNDVSEPEIVLKKRHIDEDKSVDNAQGPENLKCQRSSASVSTADYASINISDGDENRDGDWKGGSNLSDSDSEGPEADDSKMTDEVSEDGSEELGSDISATEKYHRTKSMLTLDDVSTKARRSDLTADIRLVYTKGENKLGGGKSEVGHWCEICRNSNTHWPMYENRCIKAGIKPNPQCRPPDTTKETDGLKQTTLEFESTQKSPPWSKDGLMDHLIDFVVQEDHDVPGKISYTFDAWTLQNCDPYLAVTAHYIKVDPDKPTKWTLGTDLLAFSNIAGNHSGRNTAALISRAVERYKIGDKLGWGTSDNASTNDTTMHHLEKTVMVDSDRNSTSVR
ncbi:hypothetical protein FRC03_003527 [Tulasnella sp. 419]|nr:hypothetical protein FRC03_003527 [Tulasnella sp. 419]